MRISSRQINLILRKAAAIVAVVVFLANTVMPAFAQGAFLLPAPGVKVSLSPVFHPLLLKAVRVHSDNPFEFDFVVDQGDTKLPEEAFKAESEKLIRYFLSSLTTPENDLWVNLSPYEKDRIIPDSFGVTEMGRDLLAQDYLLKQITATLMYPEGEIGKNFWDKVHRQAFEKFGTAEIPTNTFNKVWIVPQKAVVYENGPTAYISETHLKVMLEEDYVALSNNQKGSLEPRTAGDVAANALGSQVVREIILPELEKEVNEGTHFAALRQVYHSLILANWYKKRLKNSILAQIYVDKNKVAGVDIDDKEEAQKIYQRYVEAFQKGVYNYIKEDYDPVTQETIPRKYFSGGVNLMGMIGSSAVMDLRPGLPADFKIAPEQLKTVVARLDLSREQIGAGEGPAEADAAERSLRFSVIDTAPGAVLDDELLGRPVVSVGQNRIPSHGTVNEAVLAGLPKDLAKFSDLRAEQQVKVKDKYRDADGQIVVPVSALIKNTGLLGHIGLGSYYGEPVIYVSSYLQAPEHADSKKKVIDHLKFKIAQWEGKRKELGLGYAQMRQWIVEHSNAQGTGEAQQLERQFDLAAPSLADVYQDQDINFYLQDARVHRVLKGFHDTAVSMAGELKARFWELMQLPIGDFVLPDSNIVEESDRLASALSFPNPWGGKDFVQILLSYAENMTDDELAWVLGHEWVHAQIRRYVETTPFESRAINVRDMKFGLLAMYDEIARQNGVPSDQEGAGVDYFTKIRISLERFPESRAELEAASQQEERAADMISLLVVPRSGFDPAAALSAFKKALNAMGTLRGFVPSQTDLDYAHHPPLGERLRYISEAIARQQLEAVRDIYEPDVIVAASSVVVIPEDIKNYTDLPADEQEKVRAKYRNSNGVMVIPAQGLYERFHLLGYLSLNPAFGEPFIYIDAALEQEGYQEVYSKVVKHNEFVLSKWQEKMKELGLGFLEISGWITNNSNNDWIIPKASLNAIATDGDGDELISKLVGSRALDNYSPSEVRLRAQDLQMASGVIKDAIGKKYFAQVMNLFKEAQKGGPAMIFADEIDKQEPSYNEALPLFYKVLQSRQEPVTVAANDEKPDNVSPAVAASSGATSAKNGNNEVGGIDLSADKTQLDIRSKGVPVQFNLDPQQMRDLKFDGFVPVIINVTPMTNLPVFLTENNGGPLENATSQVN